MRTIHDVINDMAKNKRTQMELEARIKLQLNLLRLMEVLK